MSVRVCVVLLSLVGSSFGYSNGPPATACSNMAPNHPGQTQPLPAPYSLAVSQNSYLPGDVITVTLSGTTLIKGFFIQARNNGAHIGNFQTAADTRNLFCAGGMTVTHDKKLSTSSIALQYTTPNQNVGDIKFVVTVVQNLQTYWVMLQGPTIQPTILPTSAQPALACELPGNPMSLVELSLLSIWVSWKKPSACITSCQVEFTVRAFVGSSFQNKYVAIGFSKDHLMGDDSVIDCLETGFGTVTVQASYNVAIGKNNVVLPALNNGLEMVSGSRTNGVLQCEFKRSLNTTSPDVFDLAAQKYRLMVATGDVIADEKVAHGLTSTMRPVMSTEMIDFLSPGVYKTLN